MSSSAAIQQDGPNQEIKPRKSRRIQVLIGSLTFVVLLSVILNMMLNFSSFVGWMPAGMLIWMDRSDRGDITTELTARLRNNRLSPSQMTRLAEKRVSDSALLYQSPFPANTTQVLRMAHKCALPPEIAYVQIEDCKLSIDGGEIEIKQPRVKNEGKSRKRSSKTREDRQSMSQELVLPALEAGAHKLELSGTLAVRSQTENHDIIFSRPISLTRDLEISGEVRDFIRLKSDAGVLKVMRQNCVAIGWWTGSDEDEADRDYKMTLGLAVPGTPLVMTVWARVGDKGDFTKVGSIDTSRGQLIFTFTPDFSLTSVPNIEGARRIQVRLKPDLSTALEKDVKECFGGIVEWDNVAIRHRANALAPIPGEPSTPTNVRADKPKSKKSAAKKEKAEDSNVEM